tara:strand:+ start:403 stop:1638 length:1236 start_codon:yes stop_codon:yes gene_type:complete
MKLDEWQQQVLDTSGNICLRSGRQVGKSTVISVKAGEYAIANKKKTILVVASVERQALLLFEKIHAHLFDNHKTEIKKGKDRPTKHRITLKNGSTIHCLPTGVSGYGIRGYTVDLLIADEAAFIPEEVWTAVTPMLAVTGGDIILLSTPFGRGGYFYECFSDPNFTQFHVSSEDCPRKNEDFLVRERKRMSKLQYAQEYLGEFVDELRQFFSDSLIKQCMLVKRRAQIFQGKDYFLGVDVARMGTDESTFEIIDRTNRELLIHVENLITKRTLTTETTKMILELEKLYHFKQIFIDDGGMGVGVFDQLLTEEATRRKTVAINNASRPLTRDEKKKKRTLKEDIYNNLLNLMERGMIKLLEDDEIFLSLKSVQFEYDERGKIRIFGSYTHIAEGLIRAAWCSKNKGLNIWIA